MYYPSNWNSTENRQVQEKGIVRPRNSKFIMKFTLLSI